jgi:hypothetical protein
MALCEPRRAPFQRSVTILMLLPRRFDLHQNWVWRLTHIKAATQAAR